MHPGVLLNELSRCGIHLLPVDDDAKLAGITLKSKEAEEKAIIDISTTMLAFAYRSSKWNREGVGEDNIVVKIRENLEWDREFFEDYEPDWRYVMWWPNKVAYVKVSDEAEECDANLRDGHETHALLHLVVEGHVSEEAQERCFHYGNISFIQTVKKFLRLTRLLSFT